MLSKRYQNDKSERKGISVKSKTVQGITLFETENLFYKRYDFFSNQPQLLPFCPLSLVVLLH